MITRGEKTINNICVNFDAEEYGFEKNRTTRVNVFATFRIKGEERSFKPVYGRTSSQINKYSYELAILETAIWGLSKAFQDAEVQTQRGLTIKANTEYQLLALKSLDRWMEADWTNAEGEPLKNQLLLKRLYQALSCLHGMVSGDFEYVLND